MNRSTIIALIVFAVLGSAVFFTSTQKVERGIVRLEMTGLDTEKVDRVEMTGTNPVTLELRDGRWFWGEKLADKLAIQRMIDSVARMKSNDMVTDKEEKYAEYEVGEEKGQRVKLFSGKRQVADVVVGKAATGGGAYIRRETDVFSVPNVYVANFSKDASGWLERKFFEFNVPHMSKVVLNKIDGTSLTLIKDGDAWKPGPDVNVPEGFRFDAARANSLVSQISNLRASDIFDEEPAAEVTGLDASLVPTWVITYKLQDEAEKVVTLTVTNAFEDGKFYYAKVSDRKDVFKLPSYGLQNIDKSIDDLRDLSLVELDAEKVTMFSIVDGKKKLTFEKQGTDWAIKSSSEKVPDDFQLDGAIVTRKINALGNVRGKRRRADLSMKKAGLSRPRASVTATLEDGETITLKFGKEAKDKDEQVVHYAVGNIEQSVFETTPFVRSNMITGLDGFKKNMGAGPNDLLKGMNPEALKQLPPEVRESLLKQMQQQQSQQALLEQLKQGAAPAEK